MHIDQSILFAHDVVCVNEHADHEFILNLIHVFIQRDFILFMCFSLLLNKTKYSPLFVSILYNVNISMRLINEERMRTVEKL